MIIFGLIVFIIILCVFQSSEASHPRGERKGIPFKTYFKLTERQSIEEFESRMTNGMFTENKEVFVTAFANEKKVLRVTASIGSKYKCGASDTPSNWLTIARKINANYIYQYHNHPDGLFNGSPSKQDRVTHVYLSSMFDGTEVAFHSYLVYRNMWNSVKIVES
jgi:DNA repair protein RadC